SSAVHRLEQSKSANWALVRRYASQFLRSARSQDRCGHNRRGNKRSAASADNSKRTFPSGTCRRDGARSIVAGLSARWLAAGARVRRQVDIKKIDVVRDKSYPAIGVTHLHATWMLAGRCAGVELRIVWRR